MEFPFKEDNDMLKGMMNNFYYGKAGKGDYTPDDLPTNRFQLFWEMLRVRLSGLIRLNLIYVLVWLPTLIVLLMGGYAILNTSSLADDALAGTPYIMLDNAGNEVDSGMTYMTVAESSDMIRSTVLITLLILIPCIAITGPFTAGCAYVVRNWSRDEHAFIWTDFKDSMKLNWKKSLLFSTITAVMPIVVYMGWTFYGTLADRNFFMVVPQTLVVMLAVVWYITVTYLHPLNVSYELTTSQMVKNGLLLAIARLPFSVGIRLLHLVPVALCLVLMNFFPGWGIIVPFFYYLLIGFSLSRFITASYTNAVFDRFINSQIEGAVVNRGLAKIEDDDEDDDDEDELPKPDRFWERK